MVVHSAVSACVAGLMLAGLLVSPAHAVPVRWTIESGGNGHFYEFVATSTNWTDANASANAATYLGFQGYLATVTSAAENRFILDHVNTGNAWLGGTDEAVDGEWRWVGGPEAGQLFWLGEGNGSVQNGLFAAWNSGEPNNFFGNGEDYLDLNNGSWNDVTNVSAPSIVEYSLFGSRNVVSLPAGIWLLLSALAGLGWLRRHKRTEPALR